MFYSIIVNNAQCRLSAVKPSQRSCARKLMELALTPSTIGHCCDGPPQADVNIKVHVLIKIMLYSDEGRVNGSVLWDSIRDLKIAKECAGSGFEFVVATNYQLLCCGYSTGAIQDSALQPGYSTRLVTANRVQLWLTRL